MQKSTVYQALEPLSIRSRAEVAKLLGITPSRVMQLENSALQKLRAALEEKNITPKELDR